MGTGGLVLMKKPVRSVGAIEGLLRDGSGGMLKRVPAVVLTRVWAMAAPLAMPAAEAESVRTSARPASRPQVELAFYRKYTQALLRRYMRLSMETGRVPSLLGRELFRGHVTHYKVSGFEDAVVFCMDIERCLAKLGAEDKELIRRVALQEYSQGEAAAVMGVSLRHVVRSYGAALDRTTRLLLERRMLEPLKSCQ